MPTILIVDDHPDVALLMQAVLSRQGFTCHVAHDTARAWALLGPDVALVLLDVTLPGENGPDLLRRMQLDPTLAEIPVVFVSGRDDAATRIQCLAMGAREFLAKPVRAKVLVDKVRAVLAGEAGDDDPLAAALGADTALGASLGGGNEPAEVARRLLAERQMLRRQLASHSRLVSALARLQQMMGAGYPPDRVAQGVVQLALTVLGAERAVLWMPAAERLLPLVVAGMEPPDSVATDGEEAVARAFAGTAVEEPRAADGTCALHVPLTVAAAPVGVLTMWVSDAERPSASLSAFFCAEAALAIDAALRFSHTQSEALTDALTGLHNRRYFDRRLPEELRRAEALGVPAAVLFVDIDRFKEVNDRFGHERGDAVLQAVGGALRATLRGVDVVARYGGEEFVVLLPEADRAAACRVGERLRAAVAAAGPAVLPERPLTVTVGVAALPEDGRDPAYLLACADAAMLRGKRAGRDRIVAFDATAEPLDATPEGREVAIVIRAWLRALAIKDHATERHSVAVGALSARIARRLGLDRTTVREIAHAGLLHDVGKLYTPDHVLLKPGPLDDDEREIMERHVTQGAALLAAMPELRHLTTAVGASQEHFDGAGYPDGLVGEAIPVAARIVAVTDAFDAMTSDRPYRAAMPRAAAIAELQRCAGSQFDPTVVGVLLDLLAAERPARPVEGGRHARSDAPAIPSA